MGRPMKEHNKPFLAVPGGSGAVYAVEMMNGFVKVGRSANPEHRLAQLASYARRVLSTDIARFFVVCGVGLKTCAYIERAVLRRVRDIDAPVHGAECFAKISLGYACSLIREEVARRKRRYGDYLSSRPGSYLLEDLGETEEPAEAFVEIRSSSLASVSTLEGREFPGAVSDQVAGAGSFIRGDELLHDSSLFAGSTCKETHNAGFSD
jgi:hypothetical protein